VPCLLSVYQYAFCEVGFVGSSPRLYAFKFVS